MEQPKESIEILLEIARDLTASLAAADRYDRFLNAVTRVIPCDAACLLRLEGDELIPVAGKGLAEEAMVRRFARADHPRLELILRSEGPVRFPAESALPDPFDGLLKADRETLRPVHACLGCRLTEGSQVVGALTADALDAGRFDRLDFTMLATLAALAGAAMRTTGLIEALERTAERRDRVARELQRGGGPAGGAQLLGMGPAMRRLTEEIRLVTRSDLAVLVLGETGTGKELVARQVHELSARRDEAFIQVNCAALPESIAESELFGHVAGAFTGAGRDRAGKFEVADGGTLFLDEVGELPVSLQPKLLRAIQEGEIQRVGSDRVIRADVRLVAATNRDLEAEVAAGRFRSDLYHRLAVFPIRVPPLREHREDIPLLAAHFSDMYRQRLGLGPVRITEEARERLTAASWPGNVRELENVIGRGVLRAAQGQARRAGPVLVGLEHLDLEAGPEAAAAPRAAAAPEEASAHLSLAERLDAFRRREILAAVARAQGNWAAAARELGLHRSNLHHLAKRLGLGRE